VLEAYKNVQARIDARNLFRTPLSAEISKELVANGFIKLSGSRIRAYVKEINGSPILDGLAPLKICHSPNFISLEFALHTHELAKVALKRNPTSEEHAAKASEVAGHLISAKGIRGKILEYNRQCENKKDQIKHSPSVFRKGFYPEDVLRQYNLYCKKHKTNSVPHLRHPRYIDLVQMVKAAHPKSRPSIINMPAAVGYLRSEGYKITLRGGPAKVTRRMVREAVIIEKAISESKGTRCTTGVVTKRLQTMYPGLKISTDAVHIHLEKLVKTTRKVDRPKISYDKKPEKIGFGRITKAYIDCANEVRDLAPFPHGRVLMERIKCQETALNRHLGKINQERAKQNLLPFVAFGNGSALDIKLLLACEMSLEGSKNSPNPSLIAITEKQKSHYCLTQIRLLAKRAARDGITLTAGETYQETSMRYKAGLVWALCKVTITSEQRKVAMEQADAIELALKRCALENQITPAVTSACRSLALAEQVGRLKAPSVVDRVKSLIERNGNKDFIQSELNKILKDVLAPNRLLVVASKKVEAEIIASLGKMLEGNSKTLWSCLPSTPEEKTAAHRVIVQRTWRSSDAEKVIILEAVAAEMQRTKLSFTDSAERLLYDAAQVKLWESKRDFLKTHVRVQTNAEKEASAKQFLNLNTPEEQVSHLKAVKDLLLGGRTLDSALSALGIPPLAYQRMVYFRRSLGTSGNERLAIIDRVSKKVRSRESTEAQALELEQVNLASYQKWKRERTNYIAKIQSPDREKVLHYFRDAYPLAERKLLMQEIKRETAQGKSLTTVLKERWIPLHVYQTFSTERTRQKPEKVKSVLDYRQWTEKLGDAIQEAVHKEQNVGEVMRQFLKGVSIDQASSYVSRYLEEVHLLPKHLSTSIAAQIVTLTDDKSIVLVESLFGCKYTRSGTQQKVEVMSLRNKLGLAINHLGDSIGISTL